MTPLSFSHLSLTVCFQFKVILTSASICLECDSKPQSYGDIYITFSAKFYSVALERCMQLQPTSLCISVLVFASKAEECSGVCVCESPSLCFVGGSLPNQGSLHEVSAGDLQREARESAQIRPSRPITIPMHLGNEISPPPPQIPTFNSFPSSPCP